MEQTTHLLVRCQQTRKRKFRKDEEGRGVWHWCQGHQQEELDTWSELGLTRAIAERFISEGKEP